MLKSIKSLVVIFIIGCLIYAVRFLFVGNEVRYENINLYLVDFGITQVYTFALSFVNSAYFEFIKKLQFRNHDVLKRII